MFQNNNIELTVEILENTLQVFLATKKYMTAILTLLFARNLKHEHRHGGYIIFAI
jgi:hypothetical protein